MMLVDPFSFCQRTKYKKEMRMPLFNLTHIHTLILDRAMQCMTWHPWDAHADSLIMMIMIIVGERCVCFARERANAVWQIFPTYELSYLILIGQRNEVYEMKVLKEEIDRFRQQIDIKVLITHTALLLFTILQLLSIPNI